MVDDVADDEECWGIMGGGLECDGQWVLVVVGTRPMRLDSNKNQTKRKRENENNVE